MTSPVGTNARRAVAIALLALAVLAATGTPVGAAEKSIWGPATLPDGQSAFGLYDELGIDTLQLSVSWADVAPSRPTSPGDPNDPAYVWPAELDRAVAEGALHAIQVALLVANTPPWANGGRPSVWAPDDPQDYAEFLVAAARRYPGVRRWMIWGEPNRDDRFQPNRENDRRGPRAYAPLLDAAYGALKAESPANKVIGGMTWTSGTVKPPDFVRWMRLPSSGRPPRLDWFGHNPFPFRIPDIADPPLPGGYRDISDSDTFSREIRRAYGRRVPLWLSEYTIQSDHGSAIFATFVTRPAQARYVSAGFRLADELGAAVAGLGWLALLDEPQSADSANFGLLTHALERKPAFAAMARAPSERLAPTVVAARSIERGLLRARGLPVTVTPRATGTVTIELRRGADLRGRIRRAAVDGRALTIRLRAAVRRGRYSVRVRAQRGATVRSNLRVH